MVIPFSCKNEKFGYWKVKVKVKGNSGVLMHIRYIVSSFHLLAIVATGNRVYSCAEVCRTSLIFPKDMCVPAFRRVFFLSDLIKINLLFGTE